MKKNVLKYAAAVFSAVLLTGCPGKETLPEHMSGTVAVDLNVSGMDMRSGDIQADGSAIRDVLAYRFSEGEFREKLLPVSSEGSLFVFNPEVREGRLYILANASSVEAVLDGIQNGGQEEDFIASVAAADEMVSDAVLMTGSIGLQDFSGTPLKVRMTRSAARIDIVSPERGVKVLDIRIAGIPDRGRIFPQGDVKPIAGALMTDFYDDLSEVPLENERKTVTYVPEYAGEPMDAVVTVSSGQGMHTLAASLPPVIRRNTVYTLRIRGTGASASVSVTEGSWTEGDVSVTMPVAGGLVDTEASVLPSGVRVNAGRDTVYVTHLGTSFSLALTAAPGSDVTVDGKVGGVEISIRDAVPASMERVAAVDVSASLRMPGTRDERIHLDVHDGNVYSGRVVLVFEANPVRFDGMLVLDENGICDFGRYIDGQIGTLTVPENVEVTLEFDDGGSHWMKLDEDSVQSEAVGAGKRKVFRLLAGWKPNDPEADGRVQEGRLVIVYGDGTGRESYTVRRVNWGLPVVRIGNTWWTRYNLRGNVKEFSDQITMGNDPVRHDGQADYMLGLAEDTLLELMGNQYQGGNPDGLPLMHDGSAFYHEGMVTYPQNFGQMDPGAMAPDGYRIPDYSDFAFLVPNDDYNLGGEGTRSYTNRDGETVTVRIAEREVAFLGQHYGTVAFYDFEHDGNHWVLYGLGHQWNTSAGNIAVMNQLFAGTGEGIMTWNMEGYSKDSRPGQNWLKYAAHNATKTRTIRCTKTPVEYIYE